MRLKWLRSCVSLTVFTGGRNGSLRPPSYIYYSKLIYQILVTYRPLLVTHWPFPVPNWHVRSIIYHFKSLTNIYCYLLQFNFFSVANQNPNLKYWYMFFSEAIIFTYKCMYIYIYNVVWYKYYQTRRVLTTDKLYLEGNINLVYKCIKC